MITLMMGAPGSGKSTYIQKHRELNALVTSSELVRLDRELEIAEVMASFRAKGAKWAKQGQSFWVDATNTIMHHRAYWLRIARAYELPIRIIVMDTDVNVCLSRNAMREHPATPTVIRQHHRRMKMQLQLLKHEGYQSIEVISYP